MILKTFNIVNQKMNTLYGRNEFIKFDSNCLKQRFTLNRIKKIARINRFETINSITPFCIGDCKI